MNTRKNATRLKKIAENKPAGTLAAAVPASQSEAQSMKKGSVLSATRQMAFLLSLATFFLYSNTLRNGYAMDDIEILEKNSFVVKGLRGIPELLSTPHLRGFMIAPNETYRPLSLVMYAIEYELWGANPTVNHFFNIIVFIGCVLALFCFLKRLFDGRKTAVAFIAALLFAFHPIHTEVVANIKSRDELLCFFFGLLSLNLFIKYMNTNNIRLLLTGTLTMFLSLLSKETDITFLAVVPLIFFLYKNEHRRRAVYITGATFLAAGSFLLLREHILTINGNTIVSINMIDNELAKAPDYATRLGTAIYTMGLYLKLLFIPHPLISDYSYRTIPFVTLSNIRVILSMAAYVSLTAISIFRLIRFKKDPWAFGILFFLLCLSLFTNITFLIGSGMGERFLFCASAGFCIVAALGIEAILREEGGMKFHHLKNVKVAVVLLPLLILYSVATAARNTEWKDNKTLYNADLLKAPNSSRLNYCVGYLLVSEDYDRETNPAVKKDLLRNGIAYLQRSVEIFPEYCSAQTELGNAFFINKQYDSAEVHDLMAIKVNPQASEAINNLAGVYFVTGKFVRALDVCKQAVAIRPNYAEAYYNIGLCFNSMKQYDSSIAYDRQALAIDPGYNRAFVTMASDYMALGKIDSGSKYLALAGKSK